MVYSHILPRLPHVIIVYNTLGLLQGDIVPMQLQVNNQLDPLFDARLDIQFQERKKIASEEKLSMAFKKRVVATILPDFVQKLIFSKPIKGFDLSLLAFKGKDERKIPLNPEACSWNSTMTTLTIKKQFIPQEISWFDVKNDAVDQKNQSCLSHLVTLHVPASAFTAFDNSKNEKMAQTYTLRQVETTGTISGTVITDQSHFLVELLDGQYQVVASIPNQKKYQLTMVPPGEYLLRVSALDPESQKWLPGNIKKNVEPYPVAFYKSKVAVVEKWDITGIDCTL